MQVRPPVDPDEPRRPEVGDFAPDVAVEPVAYAVPPRVIVFKFALAVALALLAWAATNRAQTQVGFVVAAALAVYAARDLAARTRLTADRSELVVVRGYAGHRRLAWSQVEVVRVDRRLRLGLRSELLEIDAGEEIFQFSRFDLGADPNEVAAVLNALREA